MGDAIKAGHALLQRGDLVGAMEVWEKADSPLRVQMPANAPATTNVDEEIELLILLAKGAVDLRQFNRAAETTKRLAQHMESRHGSKDERVLLAWSWHLCWFAASGGQRALGDIYLKGLLSSASTESKDPAVPCILHLALGWFAENEKDAKTATAEYQKVVALATSATAMGAKQAAIEALQRLAQIFHAKREATAAIGYQETALEISIATLGESHVRTLQAKVLLLMFLGDGGRRSDAVALANDVIRELTEQGAEQKTGLSRYLLGSAISHECIFGRELHSAEEVLNRSETGTAHMEASGVRLDHGDAALFVAFSKAALYRGRNEFGIRLYALALDIRRDFLGPQHPEVLKTAEGLAKLRSSLGR